MRQLENISLENYNFEINHSAGLVAMPGQTAEKDMISIHVAIERIDMPIPKNYVSDNRMLFHNNLISRIWEMESSQWLTKDLAGRQGVEPR